MREQRDFPADDLIEWRRDFHQHPEFGFEEHRTSRLVAERLRSFGSIEVSEGIGGTGIVGTLRLGAGRRTIGLRADMDALRIQEKGKLLYRSSTPGLMHACGHDGHTTMLLGAARVLASEGGFDGTVRFIFQPAEEWGRGALAMIDDGLFERFPIDEIYGLHNLPGLPAGHILTRAGPIMSAEDIFEIELLGAGVHAARPHQGRDPLVAACALVTGLQTIVSRCLSPTDTAVVSITELVTDGTRNVLPGAAIIRGDARSFDLAVSEKIETEMRRMAAGIAEGHGCKAAVRYSREFIPLVNDAIATKAALATARMAAGADRVIEAAEPHTASEDFARFLAHVPGCFAFIGNGEASPPLHNDSYDFNDDVLPVGVDYLVTLARQRLAAA
ncbi:MAG TPA: M20 aminoacylase family protein [Nitrospiraceae bacterium]|nr:M20 aminoacylase family protein [Nitrospiraceae bacterium]